MKQGATTNEWPYLIDKKKKILLNGELMAVADAIGKTVQTVYGFKETSRLPAPAR